MEAAAMFAHGPGEGGAWWPIFPLLWFVLIAATIYLFGSRAKHRVHQRPYLAGQAVLAERYARGEINEQEYHDRLAVLRREPR